MKKLIKILTSLPMEHGCSVGSLKCHGQKGCLFMTADTLASSSHF